MNTAVIFDDAFNEPGEHGYGLVISKAANIVYLSCCIYSSHMQLLDWISIGQTIY